VAIYKYSNEDMTVNYFMTTFDMTHNNEIQQHETSFQLTYLTVYTEV